MYRDKKKIINEIHRINKIYGARKYDVDPAYSDTDKVYLHRTQSMERVIIRALNDSDFLKILDKALILDFGCGNGKWFLRWLAWGAQSKNLFGVDVRKDSVKLAQNLIPHGNFKEILPNKLPFADTTFDIITQHVVFTSILDIDLRKEIASELYRVLKNDGLILWYDFVYNNPYNNNVRKVSISELRELFPKCKFEMIKKITLAPQIAKIAVPFSYIFASILESVKIFNTHIYVVIKK